ncbi:MAG: hypothetical protein Q9P01_07585, partial [Anaerolineae bacterium]|nr:hypothetical protein [Anaerolineae bacterium]
RQAMTNERPDDNYEETPAPIEAPKSDGQEVRLFVRHISDKDTRQVNKPETSNLRLIIGIGLLATGLVAGILVILFIFNPFASDGTTATTIVANNTQVSATLEPTVEIPIVEPLTTEEATNEAMTVPTTIPSTATDEPLDIPTATNEPPTATDEPTRIPTATMIPPTATDEPTLIPTATTIPPTATPIPPSSTPEPTAIPVIEGNIELVYNGDTLIVHNIDDAQVNLTGVQFILAGETAEDSVLFLAEEWVLPNNILRSERCTQVWRIEFSQLPPSQPPADECVARSAFWSTPRTFWIVDGDKTIFEIRRDGAVLVQCPAAIRDNNELLRCMVNI